MTFINQTLETFEDMNCGRGMDSQMRQLVRRAFLAGVATGAIALRDSKNPRIDEHNITLEIRKLTKVSK